MNHGQRAQRTGPRCGILLCLAAVGASTMTLGFAWTTVHAIAIALADISAGDAAIHDNLDSCAEGTPEEANCEPIVAPARKNTVSLPFVK